MAQANNSQETFTGLKQYADGLLDRIVALPPATSGLNQAYVFFSRGDQLYVFEYTSDRITVPRR